MPQYRNKQFSSDWLRPKAGEFQNAPYLYPNRTVRTTDVDPDTGEVVRSVKKLDRGFMRSLYLDTLTPAGQPKKSTPQRFNFQFNPNDIVQSVQMRSEVYLPILQTPDQFAQPVGASSTFAFDLLLDRTMEVGAGQAGPFDPNTFEVDLFGQANPASDVFQIGILSDLQVFYSIIGQGFSNQFIQEQLDLIKLQAANEADRRAQSDPEDLVDLASIDSISSEQFAGQANIGNNAFLIPMPVRIVFSELFMVDGFVTNTNVKFTKFNTNMVPIQASIGVGVNAVYMGFAKEKTFLTVQLENSKQNRLNQISNRIAEEAEILGAMRQTANTFVIYTDSSEEWVDAFDSSEASSRRIANYAQYDDSIDTPTREFKVGFKDAKFAGDNDAVETLFESGASFSVSYYWRIRIYGTYNTFLEASSDKVKNSGKKENVPPLLRNGVVLRGDYYPNVYAVASDKKSWLHYRSESIRKKDTDPEARNEAGFQNTDAAKPKGGIKLSGEPDDYENKYFLVHVNGWVETASRKVEFNEWKVVQGNAPLKYETTLNWPITTGVGGDTGYVNPSTPNPDSGIRQILDRRTGTRIVPRIPGL